MGWGLVGKGQNGNLSKSEGWARWFLGEMKNGQKMKLGETAKGQDRYWAEWEEDEAGKGEKRTGETGNIWAKWKWVK